MDDGEGVGGVHGGLLDARQVAAELGQLRVDDGTDEGVEDVHDLHLLRRDQHRRELDDLVRVAGWVPLLWDDTIITG